MSNQNKPKKSRKKIIAGALAVAVLVSLTIGFNYGIFSQEVPLTSIPLEKLNQGYDLVCNQMNHHSLCVYNSTGNTVFNGEGTLVLPDKDTGANMHIDIFEIKPKKDKCINEFDVYLSNQSKNCNIGVGFPKDSWKITEIDDPTGKHSLFAFRNGSKTS